MIPDGQNERDALAVILAEAIDDVVDEIRLIDIVDLVSFIRYCDYPAIEDLLQASTELVFRPGTLTFGWTAAVEMDWNELPIVTLGMEFRHGPVSVFFDLTFDATSEIVEVAAIRFDEDCGSSNGRAATFAATLAGARFPKAIAGVPRRPG